MTQDEIQTIEADAAYWQELADLLGWTLHSFTFRNHASFITHHNHDAIAGLTGSQRDDIVRTIKNAARQRDELDLKQLESALRHSRIGTQWDLFKRGRASDWGTVVAAEYRALLRATKEKQP